MNWTCLMGLILAHNLWPELPHMRYYCTLFLSCDLFHDDLRRIIKSFVWLALCCSFIFDICKIWEMGLLYGCFRIKSPIAKQC